MYRKPVDSRISMHATAIAPAMVLVPLALAFAPSVVVAQVADAQRGLHHEAMDRDNIFKQQGTRALQIIPLPNLPNGIFI